MQAGWSKSEIKLTPKGYAMHGFGMWQHRAWGQQSALMARAIVIANDQQAPLIFCCLDLGYITFAMRHAIINELTDSPLLTFDPQRLVLTCTHTHSGPGGCTQDGLYNIVTPGFVPAHVSAIATATTTAITAAVAQLSACDISLADARFEDNIDVAWNRSIAAYNRNPDVTPRRDTETHLALNRHMQVLSFRRDGQTQALLSLFGVHATCCGNTLDKYSSDNKGEAASQAEALLEDAGVETPVAIFAQSTAGDVSPYYHGPGDKKRRAAIKGDDHYRYAAHNGGKQTQLAMHLASQAAAIEVDLSGPMDALLSYCDFTDIKADPLYANGNENAYTSQPCHGVSFFTGTPIDGPGMPKPLGWGAKLASRRLKNKRLAQLNRFSAEQQAYYRRIYAAQGTKDILMESGAKKVLGWALDKLPLPNVADPLVKEMKRQASIGALNNSAMVPTVLPLQIIRLGELAIVCCPGEFTTMAGERVRQTVQQKLAPAGITQVLITTYCNDYMGYVTTNEEYQQQAYEGGHTVFGQWTQAAFQTRFAELATEFSKPHNRRQYDVTTRPTPAPIDELAMRTNLVPPSR